MRLFFTRKAIEKLKELDRLDNLCLLTVRDIQSDKDESGYNRIIMRAKVTDSNNFPYQVETDIGNIHFTTNAKYQLGEDNRIDYDDFRHTFVHVRDGHMVDDNLVLEKAE